MNSMTTAHAFNLF